LDCRFGKELDNPHQILVDAYQFHPRAQSVLNHPAKHRSKIPKLVTLVPELCRIYPIPKRLVLEMRDIVSIMWGMQNAFVVQKLQLMLPVRIKLPLLQEVCV